MNPNDFYHPVGASLIARGKTEAIGNAGTIHFEAGDHIGVMDGCFMVYGRGSTSECFVSTRHEEHGVLLFRAHHTDEDKEVYRLEAAWRRARDRGAGQGEALTALAQFRETRQCGELTRAIS
jgi:hypothetical protein